MAAKKGKRKKKPLKHPNLEQWTLINYHPKTGADLRGKGMLMHKKTGKVRPFYHT